MRATQLPYRQQVRVSSRPHSHLRVSHLAVMIAIFLIAVAVLVQAGSPDGAQGASQASSPAGLAVASNPILPLGDPIIVEDDTGGEAIMGKPAVAGDGSKFLVVWRADSKDIRGARVAHDGTLLDPDGIDILVSSEISGFPAVGFDGVNFVVFFSHVPAGQSTWDLYAVRVAPNGTVLDPSGVRLTTGAGLMLFRMLGVAFDGTNFLVTWRTYDTKVYAARVSSVPANLDGPTGVLVSFSSAKYPAVAFDGTNFLVTWHDQRALPLDIYGARVTTAGVVRDPGGFLIASGPGNMDHQGVAFDGTNYLVAWRDMRPNPMVGAGYVYGARVTPTAVVLDDPPILIADDQWGGVIPVAVASDGDGFLVVWTSIRMAPFDHGTDFRLSDVFARRVSSSGEVLDFAAIPMGVAHWHQAQPTIGYDSGRFLAAFGHTDNKAAVRLLARQTPPSPPTGTVNGPSNGGWVAETNPVVGGFYSDVQAFDSELAYAAGGVPHPNKSSHIVKRDVSGWSVDFVPAYGPQYGMWAGGTDDMWTNGSCAAALHFDGSTWSGPTGCFTFSPGETSVGENIWGDGEGTVLSANTDGHILRISSNGSWQIDAKPVPNDLWDIWGSWRDDLWAVGANASVIHFDGKGWTRIAGIPTIQSINGISGSSPDNVFMVGDFGTILHWDGATWSARASGTLNHLFDVWAVSDDEAYAVGLEGTILHYESGVWITEISGTTNDLLGVSVARDVTSGVMAVWAVGDDVLLRTERLLAGNPVGAPDRYVVEVNTVKSVDAADGVLANDFDPEDDPLTAAEAEAPRLGKLDLKSDGSFVYTPDPDVVGLDAFWYDVTDGSGGIDTVRVVVEIVPENLPPTAADDGPYFIDRGGTASVAPGVLANDSDPDDDPLTAELVDKPEHGTVKLRADGTFDYSHDGSATTADSFTYKAYDGTSYSDPATVSWIIAANEPPTAADDGPYFIDRGGTASVAPGVLANDSDPESDPLTAELVDEPAHGAVKLREDGTFDYSHDGSATTADSFTYRAFDGTSLSYPATVSWIIAGPQPEEGEWVHNPATDHYYALTEPRTFADAETRAQEWEGHLVTVDDQAEQEWLYATFYPETWIGMNDIAAEGTWVWTSGEPVAYTDWCPGEPNDAGAGEDAASWTLAASGVEICWNDGPADGTQQGIVESTVEPIVEEPKHLLVLPLVQRSP